MKKAKKTATKKPKEKSKIKILGVPKGAPKYYFVKEYSPKKKKWIYTNQKGEPVTKEKVLSSKRKVYEKTKHGIKQPSEKKPRKAKTVGEKIEKDVVLRTEIFAYSVIGQVQKNVLSGMKNYFKMNGQDYFLSKGEAPNFCIMFSDIHGHFLDIFKDVLTSPVFLVGYMEFSKNSFFDFDLLDLRGGGEFAELDFSDMVEKEDGEYFFEDAPQIVSAMNKFRKLIKRKMKEYFNV